MAHRSLSLRPVFGVIALAIVLGLGGAAAPAQQPARAEPPAAAGSDIERLQFEVEALKQGQEAIQQSLAEIKAMLRAAPRTPDQPANAPSVPVNATIDLQDRPLKGSPEAALAIVEFSDYQCPYCARFTKNTYPRLEQEFIATGKVRYAMLDFPLRNHPFAFKAAEAATCAAADGKFWEMHHLLFENQHELQPAALPNYAEQIGIDRAAFEACLEEGRGEDVNADMAQAREVGVRATPTFLIGWLGDGGKVQVKEMIRGAQPYESFERVLTRMIEDGRPAADDE
ncbi:MAG TPA: thioredoxin domain-containing protein [Thermoanaerobaculia bacterium]|nr:thioredoxin domain-containing protein [Thermoanaerobaculia bacterium]